MKSKSATETLNEMIVDQKMIYDNDLELLKKQFHVAVESVKPINMVKNLFQETISSSEIKNDFISKIIGFGTVFLSKKLLLGSTHNPFKKVLGTFFEFTIANKVSNHSETIQRIGGNLFKRFFNKN